MVAQNTISLSGGAEARARFMAPVSPSASVGGMSAALAAFLGMTEALEDAAASEASRQDPAAWDPAYADPDAAADDALTFAQTTAQEAAMVRVHFNSDRMLTSYARFIATALAMQDGQDRAALAATLVATAEAFRAPHPGPQGRKIEAVVRLACQRLARLADLMGERDADATSSNIAIGAAAF
jgi:hypothetical protein